MTVEIKLVRELSFEAVADRSEFALQRVSAALRGRKKHAKARTLNNGKFNFQTYKPMNKSFGTITFNILIVIKLSADSE